MIIFIQLAITSRGSNGVLWLLPLLLLAHQSPAKILPCSSHDARLCADRDDKAVNHPKSEDDCCRDTAVTFSTSLRAGGYYPN